tara:strand:+ start:688 stop:1062 length:375 start_codon:yes stop_codon:yes gene_type:complete
MKSINHSNMLLRTVALSALCAGLGANAFAQEADAAADEPVIVVETASEDAGDEKTLDVVRVTGSRLSSEYTSVAPVDIIFSRHRGAEGRFRHRDAAADSNGCSRFASGDGSNVSHVRPEWRYWY